MSTVSVGRIVQSCSGGHTFRVDSVDEKLLCDIKRCLVAYLDMVNIEYVVLKSEEEKSV